MSPTSLLAGASLGAVVLAGAAFVLGPSPAEQPQQAAQKVTAAATPTRTPESDGPSEDASAGNAESAEKSRKEKRAAAKERREKKRAEQLDRRGDVFVEVYNNSGISGLAGSTAAELDGAGWQVVGSDNWYGTIPASTVYYPDRLRDEARLLAGDLGIDRTKPAISPMRLDRLTVILTADYS